MKKIYSGLVALLLVLGVTSCGSSKPSEEASKTESTPATSETTTTPVETVVPVDPNKILKDEDVWGYSLLGPNTHYVGGEQLGNWGQDGTQPGMMEATSLSAVTEINAELGADLTAKGVKALYVAKDVEVATRALGGENKTWGDDAKEINIAYCIKTGTLMWDDENEQAAIGTWIPSKESGKVLSLTPDTYWVTPNFAEEKDENGYDWNTDPVITSGAGKYTIITAKFQKQIDGAAYGMAVIKTEDLPEAKPAEDPVKGWKLTGTVADDGWNGNGDINKNPALLFGEDNKVTAEFKAGDLFKATALIEKDGKLVGTWDINLGWNALKNKTELEGKMKEAASDGNIECVTAGTYELVAAKEGNTWKLTINPVTAA